MTLPAALALLLGTAAASPGGRVLPASAFSQDGQLGYAAQERVALWAARLGERPDVEAVVTGLPGPCPGDDDARTRARARAAGVVAALRRLGASAEPGEPAVEPCSSEEGAVRVRARRRAAPRREVRRADRRPRLSGQLREEPAYRTRRPGAWSRLRSSALLSASGRLTDGLGYKLSGRLRHDGAYSWTRRYPLAARRELEAEAELREAYLDLDAAGLQWRAGRQQVVWGEAAGVFVADVAGAKDYREFLLPDFEQIRLPSDALLVERQGDGWHAEALWIPLPRLDRYAPAGTDFAPVIPGAASVAPARRPADAARSGEWGARLSCLSGGWSVSAFHLHGWDRSPALPRTLGPAGANYAPEHHRMPVSGATLSQEWAGTVLNAEAAYSHGRRLGVLDPGDPDGLLRRDVVDWMAGAARSVGRVDASIQYVERRVLAHDGRALLGEEGWRPMASLWLRSRLWSERVEPEFFAVAGLRRRDVMLRPRVSVVINDALLLRVGWDGLDGREDGFFGRFAASSRVWSELRWTFL